LVVLVLLGYLFLGLEKLESQLVYQDVEFLPVDLLAKSVIFLVQWVHPAVLVLLEELE